MPFSRLRKIEMGWLSRRKGKNMRYKNMRNKINCWMLRKGMQLREKMASSRFSLQNNNAGMGVIEVVLIILVLVGLALIFKSKITYVLNSIFGKITTSIRSF